MEKKDLQINDKVDETRSGGGGKPKENEKKVSFLRRVWNWIKKVLGIG